MLSMIRTLYNEGHKIQRKTSHSEGYGGRVEEWATVMEIEGRLQLNSGREQRSGDQNRKMVDAIFYCDVLDIRQKDRYVSPTDDVYWIEFIDDPMTMGNHFEIGLTYQGKLSEVD